MVDRYFELEGYQQWKNLLITLTEISMKGILNDNQYIATRKSG
jgi:hypothetical protein